MCLVLCMNSLNFAAYAEKDVYFTLDEAISYAFENDYNLKSLESNVAKAEKTVVQEGINRRSYRDMFGSQMEFTVSTGFAAALYSKGFMLDAAQMQLRVAQRSLEVGKKTLENNVKQSFYGYIVSEKTEENAGRNLEKAKEQKSVAEVRFNQGQITKLDLKSFELNVINAENNFNAQKRNRELAMASLKNTMCYPQEEVLVPVGEIVIGDMDTTPIDEAIRLSQNHNTMLNLKDVYENAKKRYDIAMGWYSAGQVDFYIEKQTMETAENDYRKNKNAYEIGIRSAYNNMMSAYETLNYLNMSLELVKTQAEVAGIRYEMGQITADDYITYTNKVYEVESSIEQAKLGAMLSVFNYRITFA